MWLYEYRNYSPLRKIVHKNVCPGHMSGQLWTVGQPSGLQEWGENVIKLPLILRSQAGKRDLLSSLTQQLFPSPSCPMEHIPGTSFYLPDCQVLWQGRCINYSMILSGRGQRDSEWKGSQQTAGYVRTEPRQQEEKTKELYGFTGGRGRGRAHEAWGGGQYLEIPLWLVNILRVCLYQPAVAGAEHLQNVRG